MFGRLLAVPAMIVLSAACAPIPAPVPCAPCEKPDPRTADPAVRWRPATFSELPGWQSADLAASLETLRTGCPRASSALQTVCAKARTVDSSNARSFFEGEFAVYQATNSDESDRGLITGYYEPVLRGSRHRSERFRIPVFGVPDDLIVVDLGALYPELKHKRLRGRLEGRRLLPYPSRAQIESDSKLMRAPVLAWVDDPVALFFLHIQGSGQIALPSGEHLRVGYADQNGHPYRSLGRHLVERGELTVEQATMPGILDWVRAHPDQLRAVLDTNPSFVFFRELPPRNGPIGALGVPLSAGYSLAVDRRMIPLGTPVYLQANDPLTGSPLDRLMLAQDTGGAIRGAVRADFYWGTGPEAGERAGRMRESGRLWLLWPKGAPLPVSEP